MKWAISVIGKREKLGVSAHFSLQQVEHNVERSGGEVGWQAWEVGSRTQLFWLRLTSPVAALESSVRLA